MSKGCRTLGFANYSVTCILPFFFFFVHLNETSFGVAYTMKPLAKLFLKEKHDENVVQVQEEDKSTRLLLQSVSLFFNHIASL